MTRQQYLADPHVQSFVRYLETLLDQPDSFAHQYFDRSSKTPWACTSLHDAYRGYRWGKENHEQTEEQLSALSADLRRHVAAGDDAATRAACEAVFQWGGVKFKANLNALTELHEAHGGLASYLRQAAAKLQSADVLSTNVWKHLRMNSAFTKIYALLLDDFIIYDSRVGAALGLLVRHWGEQSGQPKVPETLRFGFKAARPTPSDPEADKSRNPSRGALTFPAMAKDADHTRHNLRANWLLADVLSRRPAASPFGQIEAVKRLRALESALFMVGYDVR